MRARASRPATLLTGLALLAVVTAALGLPASTARAQEATGSGGAEDSFDYHVRPAAGADTSEGGSWFALDAEPGAEVTQQVVVENRGDASLELALAAVDADTSPVGGAVYRNVDDPVEATGQWLSVQRERVTLDPGEAETVDVTVTVPEDARSGQHLAGIAAWVPGDVDESEAGEGAVVAVQQRRVVAMQITLPGPAEPELNITGVEPQAHAQGVRLLVNIANDGRGMTSASGVVTVDDPSFEHAVELGTFVPDTSIAHPVPWLEGDPGDGTYQARVELDYGGETATWEGTVTLGEETSQELERREVEPTEAAEGPAWWMIAVAATAALALAVLAAVWRRRRMARFEERLEQARREGAASRPEQPPQPAAPASAVPPPAVGDPTVPEPEPAEPAASASPPQHTTVVPPEPAGPAAAAAPPQHATVPPPPQHATVPPPPPPVPAGASPSQR